MTSTSSTIAPTPTPTPSMIPAVGGVQTVRRVITYLLLATTVIIAASGVSGLLDRLFSANRLEVSFDNYGLATSLASALIAGPLAAVLWWLTWRDATMTRDRDEDRQMDRLITILRAAHCRSTHQFDRRRSL